MRGENSTSKPPHDVDAIWHDDLLGRRSDADFLLKFLLMKMGELRNTGRKRNYVLNLDAGWGSGKTYFLTHFRDQLKHDKFLVAYVDSWADDHAEDPLIAVMSAIEDGISSDTKVTAATKKTAKKLTEIGGQVVISTAKGLAKQLAGKYLGDETLTNLSNIVGQTTATKTVEAIEKEVESAIDAGGKALIERFKRGKLAVSAFKSQVSKTISEASKNRRIPLFVLIDELDRCRPTYAVALLERVKHLFDVDDVIFVLATNTDQLRHSVSALYGSSFDGDRYLFRFFNQTYRFEDPDRLRFVESLLTKQQLEIFAAPGDQAPAEFISDVMNSCKLPLRDIEQCLDILKNCVTAWEHRSSLELVVLLPLILAQHRRLPLSFEDTFKRDLDETLGVDNLSSYNINLSQWRQNNNDSSHHSIWSIFTSLSQTVTNDNLIDIMNRDTRGVGPIARYVVDRMRKEFAQRYNGAGIQIKKPPTSFIAEYPVLVRSVGRLAPPRT